MEAPISTIPLKYNRWLPYWAVFQMDMRQTVRSWPFRVWILAALLLSFGFLTHRWAIHQQAGIVQSAYALMSEIIRFAVLAGTTIVIVFTAGTISSERGTMADSVLSRGISRHQYFLGKLHARLVMIIGSFLILGVLVLTASSILLQYDVSIFGTLRALLVTAAVFAIVVSAGVTISSLCNSTVLGIALLWMGVYGGGVALWFLEAGEFNPQRLNRMLPALLGGQYDFLVQVRLIGWCLLISVGASLVGLVHFARRDI